MALARCQKNEVSFVIHNLPVIAKMASVAKTRGSMFPLSQVQNNICIAANSKIVFLCEFNYKNIQEKQDKCRKNISVFCTFLSFLMSYEIMIAASKYILKNSIYNFNRFFVIFYEATYMEF